MEVRFVLLLIGSIQEICLMLNFLIENEGINESIVTTFIFYLISHDRPIVEVLNPNLLDIQQTFENEFIGMTEEENSIEDLLNTRGEFN